jgi:hypothetical protein
MFRTSAAVGRERALNVYCIEDFVAELNNVGGLSGGIPGPLGNGTRDSGIALTTHTLFSCPDCVDAYASLVAHEIGHYLGLYHTTEVDYTSADPFSDTPRCTKEESGNDLRQCPDWEYVMFPVFHDSSSLWSLGQVTVAKTHPMVRTVAVVSPATGSEPLALALGSPFRDRVALVAQHPEHPLAGVVYDVTGKRVRDLAPSAELVWNGLDESGTSVGAGVYFVRVVGGARSETHRVVKLR